MQPGLYLVATPIGNAADLSLRALEVLAGASLIACEDTRRTGKLLSMHGIKATMVTYHDHNAAGARPKLLEGIAAGQSIALVSDAGTPGISDPGYKLVRACIEAGLPVTALPGPNAGLTGLILSGLPTDKFMFAGFLPTRAGARGRALQELIQVPGSLIFQESTRRLAKSLAQMKEILGDRQAAVGRELTKLHEEVRRGTLGELAAHYAHAGPPLGEIVIIVAPPLPGEPSDQDLEDLINELRPGMGLRDLSTEIARRTGLPRRQVYNRALEMEKAQDDDG
ncbi:MAG: 16S rRNA (cytidine(1402)-2'-O)-methyltransferase [Rhodospirillales bacterium]|nr:16S rRNA (cytidine(1402)-2'-O)-methyltransferase [Rhodospirillales bacterium]